MIINIVGKRVDAKLAETQNALVDASRHNVNGGLI